MITFNQDGKKVEEIYFGILIPGETKDLIIEVYNEGDYQIMDLDFSIDNPLIKIVETPKFVNPKSSQNLKLSYTAGLDDEKGVSGVLSVKGRYIA